MRISLIWISLVVFFLVISMIMGFTEKTERKLKRGIYKLGIINSTDKDLSIKLAVYEIVDTEGNIHILATDTYFNYATISKK